MKALMSGVYAKDWVNDFVEPDASVIEEGRKTIEFLLKRYRLSRGAIPLGNVMMYMIIIVAQRILLSEGEGRGDFQISFAG